MITITETLYKKMPDDIKACFEQLPNPSAEEVRECFPETKPTKPHGGDGGKLDTQEMGWGFKRMPCDLSDNGGNASRFFKSILYYPKASKSERNKGCEGMPEKRPDERTETGMGTFEEKGVAKQSNFHPTVKPVALMEYLIKMVTREGQIVLDPFIGSGTTAIACVKNRRQYIGIELEEDYVKIAKARVKNIPQKLL